MSLVSFVKVQGNGNHSLKQAILESLDFIQYKYSKNIRNVVIKPNMCYYWDYTTGQTTDPKFVAALIDVIRDQVSLDVNISVVESDASAMKCKYAFKILGYEKMARNCNVALVNLSEDKSERVKVSVEGKSFSFMLPETIQNADLRVNVPKIKYMDYTKISCALKNIYGCNPYADKFKYHKKIDEVIVAINKIMKFNLCILDGNIICGSQPRRLGLVMASQDPVAIDAAVSQMIGVNAIPRHILMASQEGIGNKVFIPKGASLNYFKKMYPRKSASEKLMSLAYKLVQIVGLETRLGI
jgi:uncharacterized protein (DUF362 family)